MYAPMVSCLVVAALLLSGCTGDAKVNCDDLIKNANGTSGKHTKVEVTTNHGMFKVELFDDAAPVTSRNFKTYVEEKFFDHVVFHRILKGFMMQGGKFDNTTKAAKGGLHDAIKNEAAAAGCRNKAFTLSMARAGPDTAKSEFFVNFVDNAFLDFDKAQDGVGYAVFGIVYDGRPVVDAIANVPVHVYDPSRDPMCQPEGGKANCPNSPIEMTSVKVI